MAKKKVPLTERSIWYWLFRSSWKLQGLLVFVIIITVVARVIPLEMQKRIVNEAIGMRKMDLLLQYCAIYLAAVLTASCLKYAINALQALLGQRALADMRKQLFAHIITLPMSFFRRTQPGMVVSSLITEIASAGDFVGMAISIPVTNVLTLLAFAGYLFYLNWVLALVSLAIYPMVLIIVPKLQRRVNRWNKRRVDATRDLSSSIGETITGIHEVHGNCSFEIENNKNETLVERLEHIRVIWNLYRFGVKVLNNLFTNLSPFFIFILGGYLTIKGQLQLGALVAFLSAQEKLYDPWKELMDLYQGYQEAVVRYRRTMEYFDTEPEHELEPEGREPYDLEGSVEVGNLSFVTPSGIALLDDIDFSLEPGQHLALVGFSGSGKSTLAQCICQLYKYSGGSVKLGGKEVGLMAKRDVVHNVGFVSQSPFIFSGTIRANLLYACVADVGAKRAEDGEGMPSLDDMISVLQQTGLFVDVLRFGLNTVIDPDGHEDLARRLIKTRKQFHEEFSDELADYVEFYDKRTYLQYASVAENLTFGTPNRQRFETENLMDDGFFRDFLAEADLNRPLLSLGAQLASQTVDILGNVPLDSVFFEQSPIGAEELDDYKVVAERLKRMNFHEMSEEDRKKLLLLGLRFTPGVHKMVGLPDMLERLILEGRALFMHKVSSEIPGAFTFYEKDRYIWGQTILNNILFGRAKTTNPRNLEKINQNIIALLVEDDFFEPIVNIGMGYEVGSRGDKLSGGQRQKLAIARIFLKDPPVLVLDEATSALDNKSQSRIQNLIETQYKGRNTVISVAHRLDIIKNYDQVAVMKAGKIAEIGAYDELLERKEMLHELVHGKK
ncbi:MAG: ABC transporter ATP-binding protein/permease [Desulfatibacillaceae bacterium]